MLSTRYTGTGGSLRLYPQGRQESLSRAGVREKIAACCARETVVPERVEYAQTRSTSGFVRRKGKRHWGLVRLSERAIDHRTALTSGGS